MAQVPYSGVPDATPQTDPLASVHVDAPIAAFGGAVAGAVTHLGETAQGAGKELFARAYAMQQLNVQDQSNAAVADYQNALTKNFVDYTKKEGQDAIHGLDDFNKGTEELRQQYRDNIPTPEGKYLFDQESRQARFRTVFSAGNYARGEMKKFSNESYKMQTDATSSNVAAAVSVGHTDAVDQAVEKQKAISAQRAEELGYHPGMPEYDQFIREGTSRIVAPAIRELAKTQPLAAEQMRNDQLKKAHLTDTDAQNLDPILQSHKLQQGTRSTASDVLSGAAPEWDGFTVAGPRALDVLAKSSGTGGYETIGKENPDGLGHPVGKYGVASTDLAMRLRDAGMPAMSEADFLKDHAAQDKLAESQWSSLVGKYKTNSEALRAWTGGIDSDTRVAQGRQAVADSASHSEIAAVVGKASERAAPGDGTFKDFATSHVENEKTRTERFLEQDRRDNFTTIGSALSGVGAPNGKLPTSLPELFTDPKARDAYDKLDPSDQLKVQKVLQHNINEGGYQLTLASQQKLDKLTGISYDPNSTVAERKELLDTNVAALEMPASARRAILEAQKRVAQGAYANPPMARALAVMAPTLRAYNLTKEANLTGYQAFISAYQNAIAGYGEGQVKGVRTDEDLQRIGTMILRTKPGTAGLFSSGTKVYEQPGDTKATSMAKDALRKQYGRDPTDEETGNFLLRLQFQMLGGQADSKSLGK